MPAGVVAQGMRIGLATGNIGLRIGMGLSLGVALGLAMKSRRGDGRHEDDPDP